MAFYASAVTVADAFTKLLRQAVATKQYMQTQRAAMQQATCDAQILLNVIQHCGIVLGLMNAWAATPGLAEYAKEQVNDPAYDIAAEYVLMRDAIVDCRTDLMAMFPKDANGFLLYQRLDVNGRVQTRTFTAAQLDAAVTRMNAVIASIW